MNFEKVDGRWWLIDDPESERYPLYCRGNVGEVFPNVVSPLTGSLALQGAERGQQRWGLWMGMVTKKDLDGGGLMTGIFGGYMYGSVSLSRLAAVRAPGMKPEDIDVQLYGITGAPPHVKTKGERDLRATMRMGRRLSSTIFRPSIARNKAAREEIARWRATLPPIETATNCRIG